MPFRILFADILGITEGAVKVRLLRGRKKFPEGVIAQVDNAEDLAERAMLEEKVKTAGGISEEEAIGLARKAMETDIGEIAYFFQFDDTEDGWYSYHCVVNAVDGSVLDAYGLTLAYDSKDASVVYYEH